MITATVKAPSSAISFSTSRFGEISVPENKVIRFVQAMPGFERLRRFIIIDHDEQGTFRWMQSIDDPGVAFLLTDPSAFKPGYSVPLKKWEMEKLGAESPEGLVTLVMVCVARDARELSLNLKGPVVFNAESMNAIQCVIDRDDYPSNFPIKV
ncbi:MAG: flagellar assembly protein FliW [Thermodesulfobacteriota bacterium]|nr:MAG: flagellar assembly protein FliW [Thermodesulfobacteriota bacterium]